jgi:hypothetical protein
MVRVFSTCNLSKAVAVEFIAMDDIAAETSVIILVYLHHTYRDRVNVGTMRAGQTSTRP